MVEKKTSKTDTGDNSKQADAKAGKSTASKDSAARTKASKEKAPKSRKKLCIILSSVIGGLVVLGLAIWGIVTAVIANQPLEQDWAQTYYVYLDENKLDPELKDDTGEVRATANEYAVEFYDVDGIDDPVMAINYVTEKDNYLSYYWIGDNGVRRTFVYSPSEIVLLYNIKNEKSEYYVHYESGGADHYKSLRDEISAVLGAENPDHVSADPAYTFTGADVTSVKDANGKEYSLTKFEETFVEVDDAAEATVLPVDYDKDTLKQTVKDEAYEYRMLQEVAQKHADMIKQVVADIEKRKSEIAQVEKDNAELEAKKQAEEAARKAEEEAKKGIKLESYTIAYGTYRLKIWDEVVTNEDITINSDGTCTYAGRACTWKIGSRDFTQSPESTNIHQAIIFDTGNGYGFSYFAYGNNEFGDGDLNHYVPLQ